MAYKPKMLENYSLNKLTSDIYPPQRVIYHKNADF